MKPKKCQRTFGKMTREKTDAISTMKMTQKDIFVMVYCILLPVE